MVRGAALAAPRPPWPLLAGGRCAPPPSDRPVANWLLTSGRCLLAALCPCPWTRSTQLRVHAVGPPPNRAGRPPPPPGPGPATGAFEGREPVAIGQSALRRRRSKAAHGKGPIDGTWRLPARVNHCGRQCFSARRVVLGVFLQVFVTFRTTRKACSRTRFQWSIGQTSLAACGASWAGGGANGSPLRARRRPVRSLTAASGWSAARRPAGAST